jgi:hypothetical protein
MKKQITVAVVFVLLPVRAATPEGVSERGVVLLQKPASSSHSILLKRGSQIAEVPDTFEFKTGDQFSLKVNLMAGGGYVYVLNRTVTTAPDKVQVVARGMALLEGNSQQSSPQQEQTVLASGNASATDFKLIYPADGHKKIGSGLVTIPSGGLFQMDAQPGIEALYVIISPRPLAHMQGLLTSLNRNDPGPARVKAQNEIRTAMRQMAMNTEVAEAPINARGVQFVAAAPSGASTGQSAQPKPKPNSVVAAPKVASEPYLVRFALKHR